MTSSSSPARESRRRAMFAPALPTLWPAMLSRTAARGPLPFPFSEPSTTYVYFARNAVHAIATRMQLAGTDVLFPAYCHGVELEALLAAGVRPRFYPVHRGMIVDPDEVARLMRRDTKALYLIHYAGMPGPIETIERECLDRGIFLIEDCALALLSKAGTRPLGSFGDASLFCLYKTIPAPNGGALLWRDPELLAERPERQPSRSAAARQVAGSVLKNLEMRGHPLGWLATRAAAVVRGTLRRRANGAPVETGSQHFDPSQCDLAMSPIVHQVIANQDFDAIVLRRRRNYLGLREALGSLTPPIFDDLPEGTCPLFYPLQVADKPGVMMRLRNRGIETIDFWGEPPAAIPTEQFPEVDRLRRTVLWVPCHQDLSDEAIDAVSSAVWEVASAADGKVFASPAPGGPRHPAVA